MNYRWLQGFEYFELVRVWLVNATDQAGLLQLAIVAEAITRPLLEVKRVEKLLSLSFDFAPGFSRIPWLIAVHVRSTTIELTQAHFLNHHFCTLDSTRREDLHHPISYVKIIVLRVHPEVHHLVLGKPGPLLAVSYYWSHQDVLHLAFSVCEFLLVDDGLLLIVVVFCLFHSVVVHLVKYVGWWLLVL